MTSQIVTETVVKANAALIRHPRFLELHDDIRLCQEMSKISGEPQCMVLEGLTGVGKSTLVESYTESHIRRETPSGTKVSVLHMEVPSPVTVKGLAARLLEVLGDPGAHKGALWSMNSRLVCLLKACEVQIVILDDFHHLIDADTNRVLEQVSNWLKVLIKETGIPFLVVGIEGSIERILATNRQLSRLFAVRETLCAFRWDIDSPNTIRDFNAFIVMAEKGIGKKLAIEMDRVELLHRVHFATGGVVGNAMNLLRLATLLAERQGEDTLSLPILSEAYAKRLQKHMRSEVNPFCVEAEHRFVPPPNKLINQPSAVGRRLGRKKSRQPSISEVLTTN